MLYPLDRVFGERGSSVFRGFSTRAGGPRGGECFRGAPMGRSACICPFALNAGQCRKTSSADLQHVCQSQFHGLVSAYAELPLLARIIRMVEKPDFAHARARVRNPLDKVLGKGGDFAFRSLSAQRGGPRRRILPRGPCLRGTARALWAARTCRYI